MQPCGLRDLACPWGRRSFGLKTKRFAGYAHGTLAERGLKNIHATLRAAGFRALSGAPVVTAFGRVVYGLRPQNLTRKGAKKTIMQPCELRDLAHPWERQSFGLKAGQVAECIRRTLAEKALKKHSCNPAGCGIWRTLGGDGRLASRSDKLRNVSAEP